MVRDSVSANLKTKVLLTLSTDRISPLTGRVAVMEPADSATVEGVGDAGAIGGGGEITAGTAGLITGADDPPPLPE